MRWILLLASLLAAACGRAPTRSLEVFAAASLGAVVEEVAAAWEAGSGRGVRLSFAGSPTLARQLLAVERGDVFLSANPEEADRVIAAGRAEEGSRSLFLSNDLALVALDGPVCADGRDAIARLRTARRIATGDPESVPVGRYARAWLESVGAWDELAGRVAGATNARAALALVEAGAAPLGIVYASDAAGAPSVKVLWTVPAAESPPIAYVGVALRGARAESRDFLAFLSSAPARAIFRKHGFRVPDAER